MRNKNKIKGFLILAIILSIFLPFIFKNETESFNQTINSVASLISSIAGLATLLIAIALFDKYGIETPLIEKKTETVFTFIEEYKKIRFLITGDNYGLVIRLHNPEHTIYEKWYSEKLVFSNEYYDGLSQLFKISESPFMPTNIVKKIDNLNYYMLGMGIDENDIGNYAKVNVLGKKDIGNKYGKFNDEDITLFDFLNLIDELRTEIIDWIKENSNYSTELNI